MNRRQLLSAIGASTLLSGCLADETDDTDASSGVDPASDSDADGEQPEPPAGTVVDQFGTSPTRPECSIESETIEFEIEGDTRTYATAATTPYPDQPDTFGDSALAEYVESFENAYVTHNVLCDRRGSGHIIGVRNQISERTVLDWYEDVTAVHLQRYAGASAGVEEDGAMWQSDIGPTAAWYAIDETGAARIQGEYQEPTDDPADAPSPLEAGTLVAAFD